MLVAGWQNGHMLSLYGDTEPVCSGMSKQIITPHPLQPLFSRLIFSWTGHLRGPEVQSANQRDDHPRHAEVFMALRCRTKSHQHTTLHTHSLGACHTVPITEICACRPFDRFAFSLPSKWGRTCYRKRTCYSRWRGVKKGRWAERSEKEVEERWGED